MGDALLIDVTKMAMDARVATCSAPQPLGKLDTAAGGEIRTGAFRPGQLYRTHSLTN